MRIKHKPNEFYKLVNKINDGKEHRWFWYKSYSSKQAAVKALNSIKEKYPECNNLIWKISWVPYPFASDTECIDVYSEEIYGD